MGKILPRLERGMKIGGISRLKLFHLKFGEKVLQVVGNNWPRLLLPWGRTGQGDVSACYTRRANSLSIVEHSVHIILNICQGRITCSMSADVIFSLLLEHSSELNGSLVLLSNLPLSCFRRFAIIVFICDMIYIIPHLEVEQVI